MTITEHRAPPTMATGPLPHRDPEGCARVLVWQAPLRALHATMAAAVAVLSVTGLALGNPGLLPDPPPVSMATLRAVHVVTGLVLVAVLVGRVALAFTGNQWARWQQLVPVWRERRALLVASLRYYLFLDREVPPVVGHNPLAGLGYLVLFGLLGGLALTGVALLAIADRGHGWAWALTGWLFQLLPVPTVRLVHHLLMWLVLGFLVNHLYSAVLVDREERAGELSSIVTGWKTLPRARVAAEIRQWEAHRARHR